MTRSLPLPGYRSLALALSLALFVPSAGEARRNRNAVCGNGVLERSEQCDDGNTTSGDGCDASCKNESICGNAVVEPGENCDDGNTTSGDGCDASCKSEVVCGDYVVEEPETCDDGNTLSGDGCDEDCQLEPQCGNAVLEDGEQCDDGNTVPGDGCDDVCQRETLCGNGLTEEGEQCDDGNLQDGDGCDSLCRQEEAFPKNLSWLPEEPLTVGDEYALPAGQATCERTVTADVVALDQVLFFNRLGAFLPSGMIYALRRDVESLSGSSQELEPGHVRLRADKRPRPLVLRMNVGDCLEVSFQNLLGEERADNEQPATRAASMMVDGLSLFDSIVSQGANVGQGPSGLVAPGGSATYTWYASEEGAFLFHSAGAMTGGEGDGGQPDHGLFGVVNVEPRGSRWYRSQLTAEEFSYVAVEPEEATSNTRRRKSQSNDVPGTGHPRIDYDAVYPDGHPFAGKPVVAILTGDNEIFHSDLNAIIADIPRGNYPQVVAAAPDNGDVGRSRDEAFREFTIVYHDEMALVQAFPVLETEFFAHSIRDNMAINYGTGGVGAEIISYGADKILGNSPHIPSGNARLCNDCKYEEAFLSAWTVGDPSMVVSRDTGGLGAGDPFATAPAIEALYPDDPSNVSHSYLNDHVKMRILHGGVAEHHIHHLHAHQWLHTQNSDNSAYFDSQAIGPGSAFTMDITYNGSGNRNKTPGDAIFHCHFYPHFAQGMWALWRVHDVFEDGTRKLPDAEIEGGTPIPALVPLPEIAMAPMPTETMPGFPFYIPGVPGHRPPHPPLDTVDDGGLPRHVVLGGTVHDGERGPFDRVHVEMNAVELPEDGTELEKAAMAFHAERTHESVTPAGQAATFVTNGRPGVAGAPFADPCVDDDGNAVGNPRTIKAAVFQMDMVLNKTGWHFPQSRMLSLWGDVDDYREGRRAPEPFFIRANSNDCITFYHTNLVPGFYDVDDFQVFTPTDVVGQHIHLVKFDVTASDGAANGWNYEDGTFAPEEVIERIHAINEFGGLLTDDGRVELHPREHPFFGVAGAQTTIQRWWADPLLNKLGEDRTIRTVYTHDHYGPSTHQQVGLYAALVIEPEGSIWRDPEDGTVFGGRFDGGPTSWRADILTQDPAESHREFMLEFADFQLAYTAENEPVNPPGRIEVGLPHIVAPPPVPMPEGISADDPGTFSVNYRTEPLALRVRDPGTNLQAAGQAGDLALAYVSSIERADPALNVQPDVYPPLVADMRDGDPFTPLLRAYEGDRVQIRTVTGAQEEGHNLTIHGVRWLHEPDDPTSGYRNFQMNGISEHFEFELGALPPIPGSPKNETDYLYQPGASVDDQWNGLWGLMRQYQGVRDDLLPLPNNPDGEIPKQDYVSAFMEDSRACPAGASLRTFDLTAVAAQDVLPDGTLVYNERLGIHDPTALMWMYTEDVVFSDVVISDDADGNAGDSQLVTSKDTADAEEVVYQPIGLRDGTPIEPAILRAAAGDCIRVTIRNALPHTPPDVIGWNLLPPIVNEFNANQIRPSSSVGLHPQLVHYEVRRDNGVNAGFNPIRTVKPGGVRTVEWYAGKVEFVDGGVVATPVEFGATNLIPADPILHAHKGLVGALIIEPEGSSWTFPDPSTRAVADVQLPEPAPTGPPSFREFVIVTQTDVQMLLPDGTPLTPVGGAPEDSEDSGNKAINYKTEPMWGRVGFAPDADFGQTRDEEFSEAFALSSGSIETPIFEAIVGTPVRFRVLEPGGHARNQTISISGHAWRHEPANPYSDVIGSQAGHGPAAHWNIVPFHGAGGAAGVPGDYLYYNHASLLLDAGMWGIFRVTPNDE